MAGHLPVQGREVRGRQRDDAELRSLGDDDQGVDGGRQLLHDAELEILDHRHAQPQGVGGGLQIAGPAVGEARGLLERQGAGQAVGRQFAHALAGQQAGPPMPCEPGLAEGHAQDHLGHHAQGEVAGPGPAVGCAHAAGLVRAGHQPREGSGFDAQRLQGRLGAVEDLATGRHGHVGTHAGPVVAAGRKEEGRLGCARVHEAES